jgi:hypothetical protein
VPISPALAAELGVPEDADDDTVLNAVRQLRSSDGQSGSPGESQQTNEEGGDTGTTAGSTAPATAPATQAPAGGDAQLASFIAAEVDRRLAAATAPLMTQLSTATTQLAQIRERDAKTEKDRVIGAAVAAGKISPAGRAAIEAQYDQAPGVVTAMLDAMAPNSAVNLAAAGHAGGERTGLDSEAQALYDDYRRSIGLPVGSEG